VLGELAAETYFFRQQGGADASAVTAAFVLRPLAGLGKRF